MYVYMYICIYVYIYIYASGFCCRSLFSIEPPREFPKKAQNGGREGFFAKSCPWNYPPNSQKWRHQNCHFEQKALGLQKRSKGRVGQPLGLQNREGGPPNKVFYLLSGFLLEDAFQRQLRQEQKEQNATKQKNNCKRKKKKKTTAKTTRKQHKLNKQNYLPKNRKGMAERMNNRTNKHVNNGEKH